LPVRPGVDVERAGGTPAPTGRSQREPRNKLVPLNAPPVAGPRAPPLDGFFNAPACSDMAGPEERRARDSRSVGCSDQLRPRRQVPACHLVARPRLASHRFPVALRGESGWCPGQPSIPRSLPDEADGKPWRNEIDFRMRMAIFRPGQLAIARWAWSASQ
jgi:hypothetical protein